LARLFHRGRWVKYKKYKIEYVVIGLDSTSRVKVSLNYDSNWFSLEKMFNDFENLDGSPLGKLEE
jgi:hypothetical protein